MLDFFVAVAGSRRDRAPLGTGPDPGLLHRDSTQVFNVGAASCGVPGTAAGLERAVEQFGTMPLAELAAPAARLARDGGRGQRRAGVLHRDPGADPHPLAEAARAIYAPGGGPARRRGPVSLSGARRRARAARGGGRGAVSTAGTSPRRVAEWVVERGGTLGTGDLAAYEPIARDPVQRALPRARGAHQSAALIGRHSDRVRARRCSSGPMGRSARSAWSRSWTPTQRQRTREFADGPLRGRRRFGAQLPAAPPTGSARPPTSPRRR